MHQVCTTWSFAVGSAEFRSPGAVAPVRIPIAHAGGFCEFGEHRKCTRQLRRLKSTRCFFLDFDVCLTGKISLIDSIGLFAAAAAAAANAAAAPDQ